MFPPPEESYQISKRHHKEMMEAAARSRQVHELRKERHGKPALPVIFVSTAPVIIYLILWILGISF